MIWSEYQCQYQTKLANPTNEEMCKKFTHPKPKCLHQNPPKVRASGRDPQCIEGIKSTQIQIQIQRCEHPDEASRASKAHRPRLSSGAGSRAARGNRSQQCNSVRMNSVHTRARGNRSQQCSTAQCQNVQQCTRTPVCVNNEVEEL